MASPEPLAQATHSDPLSGASREEMEACARLLALSIASHRANLAAKPVSGAALAAATNQTLEEALSKIRAKQATPSAEPAQLSKSEPQASASDTDPKPTANLPVTSVHEKRRQLRISVNVPARVTNLDGEEEHKCTLRNISWGGAEVRCAQAQGGLNDKIRLLLPTGPKECINIVAVILRVSEQADCIDYGLRFESLSHEDEERLEKVLRLLLDAPGEDAERRADARLVQRLEIEYGDAGELSATLEDISASGLMLTVPDPLELDQSLLISLSAADCELGLKLRGRVVHQTPFGDPAFGLHRVGLEFEHPSPELRERIEAVIRQLALLRPPPEEYADPDFPENSEASENEQTEDD